MVSVETIREQFDELGIEPSDDIINKCIEICINNDINDPVEFVEQWMAYSVSKLGGAEPTIAYLNEMEAHEYTGKSSRKATKVASIVGGNMGKIASPRLDSKVSKIVTYRNVDSVEQDVLEMYGCITPKTKKSVSRLQQQSKNTPDGGGIRGGAGAGGGGGSAFTTVTYSPISTSTKKVNAAADAQPSKAGQVVYTYGNAQLLKQINWLPPSGGVVSEAANDDDDSGGAGGGDTGQQKQKKAAVDLLKRTTAARTGAGGTSTSSISFQPERHANEGSKYMFDSSYDRVMILGDRIYEVGNALCLRLAQEESGAASSGEKSKNDAEDTPTSTDGNGERDGVDAEERLPAEDHEEEQIKSTWFEGVKVHRVDYPSSEPIRVLGRIVVESTGGGTQTTTLRDRRLAIVDFDEQSLRFTRLDLSKVVTPPPGGWSLFPGQTVLLEGINPRGTLFSVSRIHQERALTLPRCPLGLERPLTMVIASAPFTDRDDLLYERFSALLQQCSVDPPDVLLLAGPLADANCRLYADIAETFDEYFEKMIGTIMDTVDGRTEVCIVANHNDVVGTFVYPSHPYKVASFYRNLHLLPDPCVFSVEGGVEVAVTTVDIIKQLVDEECGAGGGPLGGGGDKIKRAYNHLFHQASFYPLNPPAEEVPLDLDMLNEYGRLNRVPNVMVCPSALNRYVREINRCVCINPGFVDGHDGANGGGSYARMVIHPPPDDAVAAIASSNSNSSQDKDFSQQQNPLPASYIACQIIKT